MLIAFLYVGRCEALMMDYGFKPFDPGTWYSNNTFKGRIGCDNGINKI